MKLKRNTNLMNLMNLKVCDGVEWDGDKRKWGTFGKWLKHKSLEQEEMRWNKVRARLIPFLRRFVGETKPCPSYVVG